MDIILNMVMKYMDIIFEYRYNFEYWYDKI